MRTPFTGVGTALITPFKKDGSIDEAAVKRLARRQIDAGVHFLSPCGTTGEAPTLSHTREAARGRAGGRGSHRPGAGAGRRRRLRHARGRSSWRATWRQVGADGLLLGGAVLQQADAGRAVSALQGDRREHDAADRALQRAVAHRRQHGRGDTVSGSRRFRNIVGIKEASGDLVADVRASSRSAPRRVPGAERRRSGDRGRDGDRRRAAWSRWPRTRCRPRWCRSSSCARRATSPRRASCITGCCRSSR